MVNWLMAVKIIFLFWIILSLSIFVFQRYLIFAPDTTPPFLNGFDKKMIELVYWQSPDHRIMHGFFHAAKGPTIIIFHGNAGNINSRKILMLKLIDQGYSVLLPEYRGYGGIQGQASEQGLYDDAKTAIEFLNHQGIAYTNMVLFGESLGSAIAIEMASRYPVAGVILQSPFLSIQSLANMHYPWNILPVWDRFDNESKIQNITVPILVFHGTKDQLVPITQGEKLFCLASSAPFKELKRIEGAAHAIPWDDEYIETVNQFMATLKKHT